MIFQQPASTYICWCSLDDEVRQRSASPHTGNDGVRISSVTNELERRMDYFCQTYLMVIA